jgi:hypothetical protein
MRKAVVVFFQCAYLSLEWVIIPYAVALIPFLLIRWFFFPLNILYFEGFGILLCFINFLYPLSWAVVLGIASAVERIAGWFKRPETAQDRKGPV